jgi:hypothetical protein
VNSSHPAPGAPENRADPNCVYPDGVCTCGEPEGHVDRLAVETEALRDSDGFCNGQDCTHAAGTEEG